MRKKISLLLAALAILMFGNAYAYEFKLLTGMSMKGELVMFKDGVFHVKTDFGTVSIDADKLDYIIVEEGDPGPAACGGKAVSGVGFKCEDANTDRPVELILGAERVTPVPPRPLTGMSIPPSQDGRNIPTARYPGVFRGDAGNSNPGLFRGNHK